ncbi:MAG: Yip1 family protein [Steroidobacter sp.]
MDFNKLIARVKAILLTPKTEWPVAATEPATVADLYKNYIVALAAIPVVFGFLKMSLIGVSVPFAGTMRTAVGAGLTSMVVSYVLSLVAVYVMALIVDALAPTFGGQKDRIQALKTVAYAYTASWIAGAGQIVPGVGLLIVLAGGIFSIYLLYLGLPHTMKCPPEKAAGYTAVSIIIAIILGFVIATIVGGIAGVGMGSFSRGGDVFSSSDDDVQFDKDSPLGKLEEWSKEVEEAGKKMEAAEKSGDQDAQAEALKQMMGAALGGGQVESLPTDRLRPFVPESLASLSRSDFSVERNNAMGLQITEAKATYSNEDGRTLNLEITDTGTAKGLLAFAGWSGMESESETSSGYEKTYREDGRLIHEEWDREGSYGQYAVVLADRFTVQLNGEADSINELKAALTELDLGGLEALKNEGVKQ